MYLDWNPVYDATCIDTKVNIFMQLWWSMLDSHCPLKTVALRRRKQCPWVDNNDTLKELMKRRDQANFTWRRNGGEEDKRKYRKLRNLVKRHFSEARRDYVIKCLATVRLSGEV